MSLDAFRHYTKWHQFANERQYDVPADPWAVIRVDPADAEYYTTTSLKWGLGRVRAGAWDRPRNCQQLRGTTTAEGLRQRFEEGRDWEETVHYEWAADQFAEGKTVRGYETLEQFRDERLRYVDDLFESIRQDGYRPNYETRDDDPTEVERIHDLEPLVVVGRTGGIRWNEGYHRLILASILGVEEIPVYVVQRHEEWQRKRDEISRKPTSDLPSELSAYVGHPDVRDVVN